MVCICLFYDQKKKRVAWRTSLLKEKLKLRLGEKFVIPHCGVHGQVEMWDDKILICIIPKAKGKTS